MPDAQLFVMRRKLPHGYEYLTRKELGGKTCDHHLASLFAWDDLPFAPGFEPVSHLYAKEEVPGGV